MSRVVSFAMGVATAGVGAYVLREALWERAEVGKMAMDDVVEGVPMKRREFKVERVTVEDVIADAVPEDVKPRTLKEKARGAWNGAVMKGNRFLSDQFAKREE